jgi:hypothetical protein
MVMTASRRSFLRSALAAPFVVTAAGVLMPVRTWKPPKLEWYTFSFRPHLWQSGDSFIIKTSYANHSILWSEISPKDFWRTPSSKDLS